MLRIYTDGACSGNPGPGGWAVVVVYDDNEHRAIYGHNVETTNNRMELTAVIEAIRNAIEIEKQKRIEIHSDSAYVVNAVKENWIKKWVLNGWKKSDGKEVQNKDLWMELIKLLKYANVKIIKTRGHSGNRWNDEADRLARAQRDKAKSIKEGI